MKLLITQFPPFPCHVNSFRYKYSFQHLSQTLSVCVPLLISETKFHTIHNHRKNCNFVYSIFYVLDDRREDKYSGLNGTQIESPLTFLVNKILICYWRSQIHVFELCYIIKSSSSYVSSCYDFPLHSGGKTAPYA
jgi:hypothetical protein